MSDVNTEVTHWADTDALLGNHRTPARTQKLVSLYQKHMDIHQKEFALLIYTAIHGEAKGTEEKHQIWMR